ncbi:MAG: hypothetical protein QOF68_2500 [Gaiellales bacterium]|nr:hypothetical protein [Gaiellales bacterium]
MVGFAVLGVAMVLFLARGLERYGHYSGGYALVAFAVGLAPLSLAGIVLVKLGRDRSGKNGNATLTIVALILVIVGLIGAWWGAFLFGVA